MKNPLSWIFRRRARPEFDAEETMGPGDDFALHEVASDVEGGSDELPDSDSTAASLDAAHLDTSLETLREEFAARFHQLDEEQAQRDEKLTKAVRELQKLTLRVEMSLQRHLNKLGDEVAQLRGELDGRLDNMKEEIEHTLRKTGEIVGRTDLLQEGVEQLANSFDRQLSQTESALIAIQETRDRHLKELRDSHTRHVDTLKQDRREAEAAAAKSRQRLGRRILEIADYLEQGARLPVPSRSTRGLIRPSENVSWRHPVVKVRNWLEIRARQRELLGRLEQKTEELEQFLRRQKEEDIRRGQLLRQAWYEESSKPIQSRTAEVPDSFDPGEELVLKVRSRTEDLLTRGSARAATARRVSVR